MLPPEVRVLQLVTIQRSRDVDVLCADAHHMPGASLATPATRVAVRLSHMRAHASSMYLWVWQAQPLDTRVKWVLGGRS